MLSDGVVARDCKQILAFSLNDPDNIEIVWLAAKKKAKLSKLNSSEKKMTNQKSGSKSNHQPSIEEVEEIDNIQHHVFLWNPKNILESNDEKEEATTKVMNLRLKSLENHSIRDRSSFNLLHNASILKSAIYSLAVLPLCFPVMSQVKASSGLSGGINNAFKVSLNLLKSRE